MSTGELAYMRKWNTSRDAVDVDERKDKRKRAVYRHSWATGHQDLMFETTEDAQRFAKSEGIEFVPPVTRKRRPKVAA